MERTGKLKPCMGALKIPRGLHKKPHSGECHATLGLFPIHMSWSDCQACDEACDALL